MGKYTSAAVLAVRLLGLFWLTAGLWMLAANVVESATEFNPSFIGYYLQSQALRPLLAIGLGVGLMFFARWLGRWMARGLDSKSDA
jgi:type IV secretory pathway TrbD component